MPGYKKHLIVKKTTPQQSKLNYVYLNPSCYLGESEFLLVDKVFIFIGSPDESISSNYIALSKAQRDFLMKMPGTSKVEVEYINKEYFENIDVLKLEVEMIVNIDIKINCKELSDQIMNVYYNFPFNNHQQFYIEFYTDNAPVILLLKVIELETTNKGFCGILAENTKISLSSSSSKISLSNTELIKSNFSFEELGIGGLKKEFEIMFRRAFVQRMFDPELIKSLGISHVKGIILHGPPGTGKTLIARRLGALLNSREPKIVNGPEILNKYVGQSEENIRNLFKEAEEEYWAKREKSQLHIIIFDEIDAICKRRGSGGSSGIGDQVVNQLLSKIDGVKALDNVLLIGMTNRLDLIDEALLRPGRFEIHLEISLPDEESRYEIFAIHTKKMSGNNHLDESVDLQELAKISKNYTGAEIAAVVRAAIGYALERKAKKENKLKTESDRENSENESDKDIRVHYDDFIAGLEDIKPAFGVDEKMMENFNRVFYETGTTQSAIELGSSMLCKLTKNNFYNTNSLLFYGEIGSGKSTIAAKLALQSGFPFIKLVSPRDMVGLTESEKVNYIKECFMAAYKSENACIILDDLEGLIEFVSIGPRFLNAVLQAIKIFVKSETKNKLFICGTTAYPEVMKECGIFECFGEKKEIGYCDKKDYQALCMQNNSFCNVNFEDTISIKKLLSLVDNPESDMANI